MNYSFVTTYSSSEDNQSYTLLKTLIYILPTHSLRQSMSPVETLRPQQGVFCNTFAMFIYYKHDLHILKAWKQWDVWLNVCFVFMFSGKARLWNQVSGTHWGINIFYFFCV